MSDNVLASFQVFRPDRTGTATLRDPRVSINAPSDPNGVQAAERP
jgi:hypothetical protein